MRIGTLLDSSGGPATVRDSVAEAGRRGLDSAWTNQLPGSWDPLTLLAGSDPASGPAELGTAVALTGPRHPVALATEALTTQAVTGGRLTLGIGPGHAWYIDEQLGLPYDSPAARVREYLEVLRPLLHGEHVTYRGRFHSVDTQLSIPAPPPRLLLSALGPRMLEIAGELTDGTAATWVRPELVRDHLRPSLPGSARVVVSVLAAVTTEPDAVRERIARDFAVVTDMPAYRAVLARGGLSGPADTVLAGSEEEVADGLRRYAEAGTTDVVVMDLDPGGVPVLDVAEAVAGGDGPLPRRDAAQRRPEIHGSR
jgi:5,10-methylenetetrahydromethanopterin reductase